MSKVDLDEIRARINEPLQDAPDWATEYIRDLLEIVKVLRADCPMFANGHHVQIGAEFFVVITRVGGGGVPMYVVVGPYNVGGYGREGSEWTIGDESGEMWDAEDCFSTKEAADTERHAREKKAGNPRVIQRRIVLLDNENGQLRKLLADPQPGVSSWMDAVPRCVGNMQAILNGERDAQ